MTFAYVGAGYAGMQRNPGVRTIEGELEGAIARAGALVVSPGIKMFDADIASTKNPIIANSIKYLVPVFIKIDLACKSPYLLAFEIYFS